MFDLNQSITEWRKKMIAGGIKTPPVLDELESHLREDVERQVRAGVNEEQAYETAVSRMGKSDLLKAEFAKIAGMKEARSGKVIGVACCLVALPLSAMAVPNFLTIRELSPGERVLGFAAVILTFLSIASWRFSHKFLPAIRNRRVRSATAIGCGLAGLAWLCVFGILLPTVIVPHFFAGTGGVSGGEFRPVFMMGISLLWAMALTAVLGGIAYGLEGAARHRMSSRANHCVSN
jgi:hypothetical protein